MSLKENLRKFTSEGGLVGVVPVSMGKVRCCSGCSGERMESWFAYVSVFIRFNKGAYAWPSSREGWRTSRPVSMGKVRCGSGCSRERMERCLAQVRSFGEEDKKQRESGYSLPFPHLNVCTADLLQFIVRFATSSLGLCAISAKPPMFCPPPPPPNFPLSLLSSPRALLHVVRLGSGKRQFLV